MNSLRDQIKNLLQLQEIDTHIEVIRQERDEAPARVADLEKHLADKKSRQETADAQKAELEAARAELEEKIKDSNRKAKRSQIRMNDIKNSRQLQAVQKELEDLKMYREEWEEQLMLLVDDLEAVNRALEGAVEGMDELESNLKAEKGDLDTTVADMDGEIKGLTKDRTKYADDLPVHIIDRYEFIRSRLNDTAVAPVIGGICQVCHMALPPQSFIELRRMEDLMTCPSCQRIIYYVDTDA